MDMPQSKRNENRYFAAQNDNGSGKTTRGVSDLIHPRTARRLSNQWFTAGTDFATEIDLKIFRLESTAILP
jgi:hypothetical protein